MAFIVIIPLDSRTHGIQRDLVFCNDSARYHPPKQAYRRKETSMPWREVRRDPNA